MYNMYVLLHYAIYLYTQCLGIYQANEIPYDLITLADCVIESNYSSDRQ